VSATDPPLVEADRLHADATFRAPVLHWFERSCLTPYHDTVDCLSLRCALSISATRSPSARLRKVRSRTELRATQIRTYDGRVTLAPNAEVFTSRITHNTADPVRRGNVRFRLGYEVDIQRLTALLRSGGANLEGVLEAPPPRLRVRTLDASDIEFDLAFWTDSRRTDFQDTASLVRQQVVDLIRKAGIGLPNSDIRVIKTSSEESQEGR